MTEEEIKSKMGTEIGSVFIHLSRELSVLKYLLNEFHSLFMTRELENDDRLELMNRSAPHLFITFRQLLYDRLILDITRFVEERVPPSRKSTSKERANLKYLIKLTSKVLVNQNGQEYQRLRGELNKKVDEIYKKIKAHRHLISHFDYEHKITSTQWEKVAMKMGDIHLMLSVIEDMLMKMQKELCGRSSMLMPYSSTEGDKLLTIIRNGLSE